IPERHQVHVGRDKEARQVLKRDQARAMNWHAALAELSFDAIRLRPGRVQPEAKGVRRSGEVPRIGLDERGFIMSDPPVPRIEDYSGSVAQGGRQWKGNKVRGEGHRRRITLNLNSALRDADPGEPPHLIEPEHLELIDAPAPEIGDPKQYIE